MKREGAKEEKKAIIEIVKFTPYKAEKGPLRGFATVKIGCVVIKGVQLLEYKDNNGDPDYAISMPSEKGKDKDGKDAYFPLIWLDLGDKSANRKAYEDVTAEILRVYEG